MPFMYIVSMVYWVRMVNVLCVVYDMWYVGRIWMVC